MKAIDIVKIVKQTKMSTDEMEKLKVMLDNRLTGKKLEKIVSEKTFQLLKDAGISSVSTLEGMTTSEVSNAGISSRIINDLQFYGIIFKEL